MATAANQIGRVTQVMGAVVDVQFEGHLPAILNSLETKNGNNRFAVSNLNGFSLSSDVASPRIHSLKSPSTSFGPVTCRSQTMPTIFIGELPDQCAWAAAWALFWRGAFWGGVNRIGSIATPVSALCSATVVLPP